MDNWTSGLPSEPPKARWRESRRFRIGAIATAGAVVVGGGAFAITEALSSPGAPAAASSGTSTPPKPGGRTIGVVRSIGSSSFTIATRGGTTVTVDVSSSTAYSESGVTHPTFANVKVGDYVAVAGGEQSATMQATSVTISTTRPTGRPGGFRGGNFPGGGAGGQRPVATGTVKSRSSDSFVVTERSGGTIDVTVSSSTTYRSGFTSAGSYANVAVGDTVLVFGSTSSSGADATSVIVLPSGFSGGFGGGGFGGGEPSGNSGGGAPSGGGI